MRFTKLYEDVKASDLFKPASEEEVAARKEQYGPVKMKEELDYVEKTKLSDGTWHIHDDLDISECNLTTLQNLNVSIVDGSFYCAYNNLTTLEGAPTTVNGDFFCSHNNLTTLEGAPTTVDGNFYCHNNQLTSLEGAPTTVNGNFYCRYNKKKFTEAEVREVCDVKGSIFT